TLVVETTMLTPGWLDGSGYPMSGGADTRIVERWTVAADGLTMEREMTIHDALYTAPLVRTRGSQRGDSTVGLIESEPCDATPFSYVLRERGELEQRLLAARALTSFVCRCRRRGASARSRRDVSIPCTCVNLRARARRDTFPRSGRSFPRRRARG